jgi:hypothetical protein
MADILNEAISLQTLLTGTSSLRDKVNATNTFGITKIIGSPVPEIGNTLGIEATFKALTDKSRSFYKTLLVFYGLNYVMTRDDAHPLRIEVFPNIFIYCERPKISSTACGVRCLCADYYYTWWFFNKQKGAYVGSEPPPYTRVSPPSGLPPRNPLHTPGLCKHLIRLVEYVSKNGFLLP